jgi:hypothetical protein
VSAWKDLELRWCRRFGGRRAGPIGSAVSDCINTPFAIEIKRSRRAGPPVLSTWIAQAKLQGKREGRPWLIIVAGHNDRRPVACLDAELLAELCERAGVIPSPTEKEPADDEKAARPAQR